ncbi:helix-turn-helix domain-containing protein [Pararcticibacter amylolyticus]|uniref:HTH cro/C1-type domain-containing protein n=1 Tax=Pararcticibacter amylolyticus TaxID=2173175 RepID=A0A2U2P9S0_9SPHI|nr:hypothetical protein [Pararcticibacter amylolyticus]PWG78095.1 hypothetical protein DDR33_24060 [Pararcticibacter amylolyticus]
MKKQKTTEAEFASQIQKYLDHFGLKQGDLGKLIGTGATDIRDILSFKRSVGLSRADRIAKVFGLRYYELGNPGHSFPTFNDLPARTRNSIEKREQAEEPEIERNVGLRLPDHVQQVLLSGRLPEEFTSSDILQLLPENIKTQIQSIRITHLLNNGKLRNSVENTKKVRKAPGKGRGETIYRRKN